MNEIKTIKKGDANIDYGIIHGGEKAFIMLPGISLTSILNNIDAIEVAYQEILKEYTIYVFDHAMPENDDFSFDERIDYLIYAIEEIGIKKACIYGVSIGGMISLILSYKKPELIEKMVIVASAAKTNVERLKVLKQWEETSNNYDIEVLNRDFFTTMFTSDYVSKNKQSLDMFIHNGSKHECECFSRVIRTMYNFNILDNIKNVNIPTFVIGSELDPIFGRKASEEIAEALGCDLFIYKGYSHAFYDEAPDFKHKILKWLNNK